MRHLVILCALQLLVACSDPFTGFPESDGDAGGDVANDGGAGGSGAGVVTSAGGFTTNVGGGGSGTSGGVGGGNTCTPSAQICSGDTLLTCDGVNYVFDTDCTVGDGLCLASRCEFGITALLRFTEGSGTVTSGESPSMLQGLHTGTWMSGFDGGNAVSFDGNSEVDFGGALDSLGLPFSVSAWVNIPPGSNTTMTVLATNTIINGDYAGIWLDVDAANGNTVVLAFGNGAGVGPANRHAKRSSSSVPQGVWTHVTGVFTAPDVASIYIDGVDAGGSYSGTATFVGNTGAPMFVGRAFWTPSPFIGGIDDIRIYNRALSPVEAFELSQL